MNHLARVWLDMAQWDADRIDRLFARSAPWVFIFAILTQSTTLPDVFNLRSLTRLINLAILLYFLLCAFFVLFFRRPEGVVKRLFLTANIMVLAGFSVNFYLSLPEMPVGFFASTIPFIAALSFPFLRCFCLHNIWKCYYYLIIIAAFLSIIDYYLVMYQIIDVRILILNFSEFYSGLFTLFHFLEGGEIYYRLYGVFHEPGTLALFALPAIVFAILNGKWLAVIVLLLAFSMADSTGGYIALVLSAIMVTILAWRVPAIRMRSCIGVAAIVIIAGCGLKPIVGIPCHLPAVERAEPTKLDLERAEPTKLDTPSYQARSENILGFLTNLPTALYDRPLGFRLHVDSLSQLDVHDDYHGSNFMPYVAFVQGGVLALVGYITLCLLAIAAVLRSLLLPRMCGTKRLSPHGYAHMAAIATIPAMLLFALQRQSFMETLLFAFLYASPILTTLVGRESNGYQGNGRGQAVGETSEGIKR